MKEIIVNSKKYGRKAILIDDDDFLRLNNITWCIVKGRNTFYARTNIRLQNGKYRNVQMHRYILNETDKKKHCDHADGNGLNNVKSNLRSCTIRQNCLNKSYGYGASKYKGVTVSTCTNRHKMKYFYWSARVVVDGIRKTIGKFPFTKEGEVEAAKAYDREAKKNYGEFANLNFKNQ